MSYIFRSKILNNTLMGYSRKKIHTSPNYGWQDPLSPSFLPTFPGLLEYGDPFLAPDFTISFWKLLIKFMFNKWTRYKITLS